MLRTTCPEEKRLTTNSMKNAAIQVRAMMMKVRRLKAGCCAVAVVMRKCLTTGIASQSAGLFKVCVGCYMLHMKLDKKLDNKLDKKLNQKLNPEAVRAAADFLILGRGICK